VPPLPPHVTFDQARTLAHALAKGDSAAPQFVKQSLRGKLAEFLTR
jgi:pyruvate dehydrogenase (quinone)